MKKYIVITILLFMLLGYAIETDLTLAIDHCIYSHLITFQSDGLTSLFKLITFFGGTLWLVILGIALLMISAKVNIVHIPFNMLIALLSYRILKGIYMRPRPDVLRLIYESNYSFPSGHATLSMVTYGLLILELYYRIKNKKIRNLSCALLAFLILGIGISRIYLGVHYFTDIIGGYLVGLILIFIDVLLVEKKKIAYNKKL